MAQQSHEVSAPAIHAARIVLRNFDITEKPGGKVRATERNLGIIIDVCTGIFRVERVMDQMIRDVPWADKHDLANNLELVRESIRALEIVKNRLPSYQINGTQTIERRKADPPQLSRADAHHLQQVSNAIRNAQTPAEEQKILRAAGILR